MQIKLNEKAVKAVKATTKSRELTISGHPNLVLKVYPVRRQNLLDRSDSSLREYPVHQLS